MIDKTPGQLDLEPARSIEPTASEAQTTRAQLGDLARALALDSRAELTRAAYRSDWRSFVSWCGAVRACPLPATAETVAAYLAHLYQIGRAPSTVDRALTAISQAHRLARYQTPTLDPIVRETRSGLRRRTGTKQKKSEAITLEHLLRMLTTIERRGLHRDSRDAAILAIGWAAALRRSEITALDIADLVDDPRGLLLTIRKSKGDQERAGLTVPIPFGSSRFCPVRIVRSWTDGAGLTTGPLFRPCWKGGRIGNDRLNARQIDRIVREVANAAGYRGAYSAHSLRAGVITEAAARGISDREVMRHSRHKSPRVYQGYVRPARIWSASILPRVYDAPDLTIPDPDRPNDPRSAERFAEPTTEQQDPSPREADPQVEQPAQIPASADTPPESRPLPTRRRYEIDLSEMLAAEQFFCGEAGELGFFQSEQARLE